MPKVAMIGAGSLVFCKTQGIGVTAQHVPIHVRAEPTDVRLGGSCRHPRPPLTAREDHFLPIAT
jgi:hypothetical protein